MSLKHCTGALLIFGFLGPVTYQMRVLEVRLHFLVSDVRVSTSFLCYTSGVWDFSWVLVVESFWILVKWIYGGCYQSTFGIGGTSVFKYSGLSIAALEWSGFISSLYFGLQLELYYFKCFVCLFAGPGPSFRSSVPGRCCIGCIGSELAFFCEMARLSTCLTGRVNSFRLSFGSVTVFFGDIIFNVVIVVVGKELFAQLFLLPEVFSVLPAGSICLFSSQHRFLKRQGFYGGGTLIWVSQLWYLQLVVFSDSVDL